MKRPVGALEALVAGTLLAVACVAEAQTSPAIPPSITTPDRVETRIGTLEFNSAVYYRYAAVNLDLLADADHLGKLSAEEQRKVVAAFIEATVMAVPGARKNSMNASVPPSFVLGIYKEKGQPVQLINAFEAPVKGAGLVDGSVKALTGHHAQLKDTWGIQTTEEAAVPEVSLAKLIEKLTAHVA